MRCVVANAANFIDYERQTRDESCTCCCCIDYDDRCIIANDLRDNSRIHNDHENTKPVRSRSVRNIYAWSSNAINAADECETDRRLRRDERRRSDDRIGLDTHIHRDSCQLLFQFGSIGVERASRTCCTMAVDGTFTLFLYIDQSNT
jgi:hypothetical protein